MTDQHMLVAVTLHADGSMSNRVWPMPAAALAAAVEHLGEPKHAQLIPADVRRKAGRAVRLVRAASIETTREDM